MILYEGADVGGASDTNGFLHSSIRSRELRDQIIVVKLQLNVLGVHLTPHSGHTPHVPLLNEGIVPPPEGRVKFPGQ